MLTPPDDLYAFPWTAGDRYTTGMTLRDYTAIRMVPAVMQANPDWVNYNYIATDAYKFADAMLAARKNASCL